MEPEGDPSKLSVLAATPTDVRGGQGALDVPGDRWALDVRGGDDDRSKEILSWCAGILQEPQSPDELGKNQEACDVEFGALDSLTIIDARCVDDCFSRTR